jgi:hypothetical protein
MLRQELSALDSLNEASDQEVAVSDFPWDELVQDSPDWSTLGIPAICPDNSSGS